MASYKVAQDVEAEDKLLGPFSFRQFVYLLIAAMAGVVAWGLSQLFVPLFIIPTPIIVFFVVLALPLRKDQPMEIYLAAIVSFYIKPRKRLWQPDGVEALIEITAPREEEKLLTKSFSSDEADRRLEYLAAIADTQGWSIRTPHINDGTSMNPDIYHEAQQVPDNLDADSPVAQSFDAMISQADAERRQAAIDNMNNPAPQQLPAQTPANSNLVTPATSAFANVDTTDSSNIQFNPYPTSMRQHVIDPNRPPQPTTATPPQPAPQPAAPASYTATAPTLPPTTQPPAQPSSYTPDDQQATSSTPVSPDIISLANNNDLSIETIAREAHRIEQKHKRDDEQEVVISLR